MSELAIGLSYGAATLLVMFSGMPIAFALGTVAVTFMYFFMPASSLDTVAQNVYEEMASITLLSIPLFIMKGAAIGKSRAGQDLYSAIHAWLHKVPGGLGIANVFACALFAAVSGSSPATVVAIGSVILPAMVKQGFPPRFGAGILTTSGSLGILIPPSIAMVMYSVSTNVSVGAMFIAGIVPGIVLAMLLGFTTWNIARKNNYPRMPKANAGERWLAFRESVWGLLLIVVVMGGIYSGIFTPTEAAAMSAVYVTASGTPPRLIMALMATRSGENIVSPILDAAAPAASVAATAPLARPVIGSMSAPPRAITLAACSAPATGTRRASARPVFPPASSTSTTCGACTTIS